MSRSRSWRNQARRAFMVSGARAPRPRRLRAEVLEDRRLLAFDPCLQSAMEEIGTAIPLDVSSWASLTASASEDASRFQSVLVLHASQRPVGGPLAGEGEAGSVSAAISAEENGAIVAGLRELANFGNQLDAYAQFSQTLPLINRNLGDLLDIGGAMQAGLSDPIQDYLELKFCK